ncbi:hypothetical protein HMPREF9332_01678 [Alloprevotella rava F0323]|uniref:Uncharacterized protein n=1 Tax=Alloprevotella rava F0323 TaxID=679199 RepID=G5GDM7_9BACT|nr:transporter [Alloprevotella rava]EHG21732.1 hypothetical protein HMPREF9332_01678 [Alloprevotella rava F0323]
MNRFIRLLKDWTLPVSIALGAGVYLIFAYTPGLEQASAFFAPIMETILPMFMFFILFVTFCKVDFRKMIPVRWHLWIGGQQVLFVLLMVALILCFSLKGDNLILAEGILACIIGPCAAAAPVVTAKLGGNLESMTTYTFISNFITAVLIPVFFPLIEPRTTIDFAEAFFLILYKVTLVLIVPMGLAFIVKHFFSRFHYWVIKVKDLSYYLWGASLTIVTGTTVKNICHAETSISFLLLIAAMSLFLCFLQFAVGWRIGSSCGSIVESGQALGQKNTAFAIWIASVYLNPLSSVGPGCYILWQNIINSIELWRKGKAGKMRAS